MGRPSYDRDFQYHTMSALIFPMEGIAQLEFELLNQVPIKNYSGKKYQGQTGITPAKVI